MSACHFNIPFTGDANSLLDKAKTAVEENGGSFHSSGNAGHFNVSVLGNVIAGHYSIEQQEMRISITDRPFFIPCKAIEGFLSKQLQ